MTVVKPLLTSGTALLLCTGLFLLARHQIGDAGVEINDPLIRVPGTQPSPGDASAGGGGSGGVPGTEPARALLTFLPIGEGGRTGWRKHYPDGRLLYEFQASSWRPLNDSKMHVDHPRLHLNMPTGQQVWIEGDESEVVTRQDGSMGVDRGWIGGNVRLKVSLRRGPRPDAVGGAGAAGGSGVSSSRPRDDELVVAHLDRVDFDISTQQIRTAERFEVTSRRVELSGEGLAIAWNSDQGLITRVEIGRGERLVLRGLGATRGSGGALSGSGSSVEQARQARLAAARGESGGAAGAGGLPRSGTVETYRATLAGGVECIRYGAGGEAGGTLLASDLALLFDLGRRGSDAERKDDVSDEDLARAGRLEIRWSGAFQAEPIASRVVAAGEAGDGSGEARLELTARGRPVVLRDRQGELTCGELFYNATTGEARLRDLEQPIVLRSVAEGNGGGGRRILAEQSLLLDQAGGRLVIEGPGQMQDSGGDGRLQSGVSWDERMELWFDAGTGGSGAVAGGGGAGAMGFLSTDGGLGSFEGMQRSLRKASFDGNVVLQRGQERLSAQGVDIWFDPAGGSDLSGSIRELRAESLPSHPVLLSRGADRLTCETLKVSFVADGSGVLQPAVAVCEGGVEARQGRRRIEAAWLEAEFAAIPIAAAEAGGRALQEAAGAGLERPAGALVPQNLSLSRIRARGQVRVEDPEAGTEAVAEALDAGLGQDGQLTRLDLVGEGRSGASASTQQFSIRGRRVGLDMGAESAAVDGAGELGFVTRGGALGGSSGASASRVRVVWSERMLMDGRANVAKFSGGVVATSETDHIEARELTIHLADEAAGEAGAGKPAGAGPGAETVAGVRSLFDRLSSGVAGPSAPGGGGVGVLELPRKQLTGLHAVGAVRAKRSRLSRYSGEPVLSVRVVSEELSIDLPGQQFRIPGAGELLVEDYRLADRLAGGAGAALSTAARGGAAAGPLLGHLGGSGLSQTLFAWTRSMEFSGVRSEAVFSGDVQIAHRAGSEMVNSRQMQAIREQLARLPQELLGRRAMLRAGDLRIGFGEPSSDAGGGDSLEDLASRPISRFEARGDVSIRDGDRYLSGSEVRYVMASELLFVSGGGAAPARFGQVDAKNNRFTGWEGPSFEWNRRTGRIVAPQATLIGG